MSFNITIDGSIRHKKLVSEYVNDILEDFFTVRFQRNVDIWINFQRTLEPGYHGFCHGDRDEVWLDIAKGVINPETNSYLLYNYSTVLITLAHELVHAKQIIKGELSSDGTNWSNHARNLNWHAVPYIQLPWEVEASRQETRLYVKHWLNKNKPFEL